MQTYSHTIYTKPLLPRSMKARQLQTRSGAKPPKQEMEPEPVPEPESKEDSNPIPWMKIAVEKDDGAENHLLPDWMLPEPKVGRYRCLMPYMDTPGVIRVHAARAALQPDEVLLECKAAMNGTCCV